VQIKRLAKQVEEVVQLKERKTGRQGKVEMKYFPFTLNSFLSFYFEEEKQLEIFFIFGSQRHTRRCLV